MEAIPGKDELYMSLDSQQTLGIILLQMLSNHGSLAGETFLFMNVFFFIVDTVLFNQFFSKQVGKKYKVLMTLAPEAC